MPNWWLDWSRTLEQRWHEELERQRQLHASDEAFAYWYQEFLEREALNHLLDVNPDEGDPDWDTDEYDPTAMC